MITFESGLNGIEPNEDALRTPWVSALDQRKGIIDMMAEDNFFSDDTESITKAIETMEDIDRVVRGTNLYYKEFPEKEKLMVEILNDMSKLKAMKTGMDSTKLREAMVAFNDNLEAAQKSFYRTYLRNLCADYNSHPYAKRKYLIDQKTNLERSVKVGGFENGKFVQYSYQKRNTEVEIPNMTEYDYINYNGILSGDSQNITGFFSFLRNLDKSNEQMVTELSRRGINNIFHLQDRPSDTR